MLNRSFIQPGTIALVGGSANTSKPGGNIIRNLISDERFEGELIVINPNQKEVQGIPCLSSVEEIDKEVDLGILAIPAHVCLKEIQRLHEHCATRSFVILSAGFKEIGSAGNQLENALLDYALENNLQIVGPNCIGWITPYYPGAFTTPIPVPAPQGVDLVSSSGATAVFLMEQGLSEGLQFNGVYSVGNAMMVGIEEVLEFLDHDYNKSSSQVKMLYIESIHDPIKFHKHCLSLSQKGCRLVAIKSGTTEVGQKAASSHTGALSNPDQSVGALFRKSGVIRCDSRDQLITLGKVLVHPELRGNRLAVITHAGGPGVMLADNLENSGFELPAPRMNEEETLLANLHHGSSVKNPFDILATGTEKELQTVLSFCLGKSYYNGICIIFGSPGLFDESLVFELIRQHQKTSSKPIYTVIPSNLNASREIQSYTANGGVYFSDEAQLAQGLELMRGGILAPHGEFNVLHVNNKKQKIEFIPTVDAFRHLEQVGMQTAEYLVCEDLNNESITFLDAHKRIVLKAIDMQHKSDQKAVFTDICTTNHLDRSFRSLREQGYNGEVLLQEHLSGHEIYLGISYDENFGHNLYVGEGGIYVEARKDIVNTLYPINKEESEFLSQELRVREI
jgi:acetyltransferase